MADARSAFVPKHATDSARIAYELHAQRVWARHARALDALGEIQAHMRGLDMLRDASPDERVVLLEELGDYLKARGSDAREVERDVNGVLAELDANYRDAIAVLDWAKRAKRLHPRRFQQSCPHR